MIPRRVRGTTRRGFVFDPGTCMCQNIKCSGWGSRYGGGEPVRASSEAETRARGVRPSSEAELTRGGIPPSSEAEHVSAALCPSSEAEFHSRVAGPTVLVGRWGHQGRGPLPLGRDYFERVLGL
jgi:hypothetical protein